MLRAPTVRESHVPAPADSTDPFHLQRFVHAQADTYATALAELRAGRKRTHWMWFVFPQLAGLGTSETARLFAIRSLDEARAYLAHPVLGPRLLEIAEAALLADAPSAHALLGSPDDRKLHSCATLFAAVSPPGSVFERLLERWYDGRPDVRTRVLLDHARDATPDDPGRR